MHFPSRSVAVSVLVGVLALATPSPAYFPSTTISKCLTGKIKQEGKGAAAYTGCYSKNAAKPDPAALAACLPKTGGKLVTAFGKLDVKAQACPLLGDGPARDADTAAFALALDGTVGGPTSKCNAAKQKLVGKYVAAIMGCYAKAANKTGLVDTKCTSKALANLTKAINKVETKAPPGECDNLGQASALTSAADAFLTAQICLLDPANPNPMLCVPPPTPTPTATATATPTLIPTPTVTSTPLTGDCGNGLNDPGEACDASAPSSGWGACGSDFSCVSCNCACPTRYEVSVDAADPASVYDLGWSGLSFRQRLTTNGTVTYGLGGCTGSTRPCGTCNVTGVVDNVTGKLANRRCTSDTSIACTSDAACTATGGTCQHYLASWQGLSVGGINTCIANYYTSASGTVNVETGNASVAGNVGLQVAAGLASDQPCSRCLNDPLSNDGIKGGTCSGGPRNGLTCDANATQPGFPDFGTLSLDCPPVTTLIPSTLIVDRTFPLTSAAGPVTKTVTAANPTCLGSLTEKCLCDTCNNLSGDACETNADCPDPAGPIGPICGGRRCINSNNAGDACNGVRQCVGGPNDYASCAVASHCPLGTCAPFCTVTCTGGPNVGAPCISDSQCPGIFDGCPTALCGRPGEPPKPSACTDSTTTPGVLDCTDTAPVDGVGACTVGPNYSACSVASGHPQRGCFSDVDCGACSGGSNAGTGCVAASQCPGGACSTLPGSCVAGTRACFLTGSAPGFGNAGTGTLIAPGANDTPIRDVAHPTLGTVACVPPGSSLSLNAFIGLPGPLRMTRKATVTAHP